MKPVLPPYFFQENNMGTWAYAVVITSDVLDIIGGMEISIDKYALCQRVARGE